MFRVTINVSFATAFNMEKVKIYRLEKGLIQTIRVIFGASQHNVLAPFVFPRGKMRQRHNEGANCHDHASHCQPFCFLSSRSHKADKNPQYGGGEVV